MKIEILDRAEEDLVNGFFFYEAQQKGLGSYFLDSLYSDIDSFHLYAGFIKTFTRSITVSCLVAFPLPFSTQSRKTAY